MHNVYIYLAYGACDLCYPRASADTYPQKNREQDNSLIPLLRSLRNACGNDLSRNNRCHTVSACRRYSSCCGNRICLFWKKPLLCCNLKLCDGACHRVCYEIVDKVSKL